MNYLQNLPNISMPNITAKGALETLGLRRIDDHNVMSEVVLPSIALFALGAVVGAGAALLFAPKSGRELRHDLTAKASELKSSVRNALPKYGEHAEGGQGAGQHAETYERPEFG